MNKDKVYLQGYIVGFNADTVGHKELNIQLPNMDIVEIDESFVYRNIDEPQKPVVPQFVADWIEECKNDDFHLFGAMESISSNQKKLDYWFREDDNMELFARAWLDGYEVEQEKRYRVKLKSNNEEVDYLVDTKRSGLRFYSNIYTKNREHTREEIESAGFGWVFDCPGIEIEEVEE